MSIDVAILNEVSPNAHYYLCPIDTVLYGQQFYAAFSNSRQSNSPSKPYMRPQIIAAKSAVFRRWEDLDYTGILPAIGDGLCAGKWEGDFISAETPYPWCKGLYTFEFVEMHPEKVRGRANRWVGLFVFSHSAKTRTFIGALRFPFERFFITKQLFGSFVEVYAGNKQGGTTVPPLRVAFGNTYINGEPHEPLGITAVYAADVPRLARAVMAVDHLKDYPEDRPLLRAPEHTVVVTIGSEELPERSAETVLFKSKKSYLEPNVFGEDMIKVFLEGQMGGASRHRKN